MPPGKAASPACVDSFGDRRVSSTLTSPSSPPTCVPLARPRNRGTSTAARLALSGVSWPGGAVAAYRTSRAAHACPGGGAAVLRRRGCGRGGALHARGGRESANANAPRASPPRAVSAAAASRRRPANGACAPPPPRRRCVRACVCVFAAAQLRLSPPQASTPFALCDQLQADASRLTRARAHARQERRRGAGRGAAERQPVRPSRPPLSAAATVRPLEHASRASAARRRGGQAAEERAARIAPCHRRRRRCCC